MFEETFLVDVYQFGVQLFKFYLNNNNNNNKEIEWI